MDILIDKKYFTQAVSEVSKSALSSSSEPVFSCLKIEVTSEGATLLGVNGDFFIERFVPETIEGRKMVEINEPGMAVVPAKAFHDLLKKLPNPISLRTDEQSVLIMSGEISTTLHCIQSIEFPSLPIYHSDQVTNILSSDLSGAIKQTLFAASKSDTRPVLTGINMIFSEDKLTFVATNSQRLAKTVKDIKGPGIGSFTVSGTCLNELAKLLETHTGIVEMVPVDNFLIFMSGTVTVYARLIAGNYPDISGLIPNDFQTIISIDSKQLLQGIDRACLFSNDSKNHNVHLKLTDGKLNISSSSTETGKITETQELLSIEGEENLNLAFDGRYLMDALKTIKEEVVRLKFGGTMRPVLVETTNEDSMVHLISPVRTTSLSE